MSGDSKAGFDALSPNGFTKGELRVATETSSDNERALTAADGQGQAFLICDSGKG